MVSSSSPSHGAKRWAAVSTRASPSAPSAPAVWVHFPPLLTTARHPDDLPARPSQRAAWRDVEAAAGFPPHPAAATPPAGGHTPYQQACQGGGWVSVGTLPAGRPRACAGACAGSVRRLRPRARLGGGVVTALGHVPSHAWPTRFLPVRLSTCELGVALVVFTADLPPSAAAATPRDDVAVRLTTSPRPPPVRLVIQSPCPPVLSTTLLVRAPLS